MIIPASKMYSGSIYKTSYSSGGNVKNAIINIIRAVATIPTAIFIVTLSIRILPMRAIVSRYSAILTSIFPISRRLSRCFMILYIPPYLLSVNKKGRGFKPPPFLQSLVGNAHPTAVGETLVVSRWEGTSPSPTHIIS